MPTRPNGQSGGGPSRAAHLCALVQPDHPVVHRLLTGCQAGPELAPGALVDRLCGALRTWSFAARFGPSSYDAIAAERSGNCIDLSALLCAALRRCGVERCYVVLGSRRQQFPAGMHAWLLVDQQAPPRWLLVDPEALAPEPCDPADLGQHLTMLAVFNDRELFATRAQHQQFFDTIHRGGTPHMETNAEGGGVTARRPARNEPVEVEEQGEGFHAVLASAAGNVLITNDMGRDVLDLCDGTRTAAEIVAAVASRFPDVSESRIAGDVEAFIETAVGKGALSWQP